MINGKSVLALVPARSGSKGLPGKNTRQFCGKPLIGWSIAAGRASRYVDAVWVSTDSDDIAEAAQACGGDVPFTRPPELASDTASSSDVVIHAIRYAETQGTPFDIIVLLEPTSPLREPSDIDGALEKLFATEGARSIVGVCAVEAMHPAFLFRNGDGLLEPYLGVQPTGVRRQTLEPLVFIEGSVYASYVEDFLREKSFYHARTTGWQVPRYKAVEIDELSDFVAAEALLRAKHEGMDL
ncbi:MAG: acylneuraminate cytidylyltransferase family protein [Dechloromonas sp.]|nr:MAG: acylneuraminate cytidylyltransferase family protein [Dechloromonas sp.]